MWKKEDCGTKFIENCRWKLKAEAIPIFIFSTGIICVSLCCDCYVFLKIVFTGRKRKSPEERAGSLQPDVTGQDTNNSCKECSKSGDIGKCHSCYHPIANTTNEGQNTSETKTLPEENGNLNSIETPEEPTESTDRIAIDVTKAILPQYGNG